MLEEKNDNEEMKKVDDSNQVDPLTNNGDEVIIEEIQKEVDFEYSDDEQKQFPRGLKIVAILSLVSVGFSLISEFFQFFKGKLTSEELLDEKVKLLQVAKNFSGETADVMKESAETLFQINTILNESFNSYHIVSTLILLIGLAGVVFMLKLNKVGFHLYIVYCLLSIINLYLFLPAHFVSMNSLFIALGTSGLFIWLYSRNLKFMK